MFGSSLPSVRTVLKPDAGAFLSTTEAQQRQAPAVKVEIKLNSQLNAEPSQNIIFFCLFYEYFQIVSKRLVVVSKGLRVEIYDFQQWIPIFLAF